MKDKTIEEGLVSLVALGDVELKVLEQAYLILASVRAALRNGVKHFSLAGVLLRTEEEVIKALIADGQITLDISQVVQITTELEELKAIRDGYIKDIAMLN
jgi:hypothetical protein